MKDFLHRILRKKIFLVNASFCRCDGTGTTSFLKRDGGNVICPSLRTMRRDVFTPEGSKQSEGSGQDCERRENGGGRIRGLSSCFGATCSSQFCERHCTLWYVTTPSGGYGIASATPQGGFLQSRKRKVGKGGTHKGGATAGDETLQARQHRKEHRRENRVLQSDMANTDEGAAEAILVVGSPPRLPCTDKNDP